MDTGTLLWPKLVVDAEPRFHKVRRCPALVGNKAAAVQGAVPTTERQLQKVSEVSRRLERVERPTRVITEPLHTTLKGAHTIGTFQIVPSSYYLRVVEQRHEHGRDPGHGGGLYQQHGLGSRRRLMTPVYVTAPTGGRDTASNSALTGLPADLNNSTK
ncbi:hypothetical protein FIBSPDRAFT_883111 [Athelia psychrophila]|uniref:Uncharacterized protein n=1 Tax=Athelia psychrophila TaxID=1759441 RepID=A0A166UKD4_9AGAM|nr:hypothetical protein FIBSPDRAFT_883111 [Fibularhizoctonia sp. CBS 109695]